VTTLTRERAEWITGARAARGRAAGDAEARFERARLEHFDGLGGRLTLDEFIVRAWEGLSAHSVVDCPVCGGAMEPAPVRQGHAAAGRCRSCGTTLG
jgi:hypothetical protein